MTVKLMWLGEDELHRVVSDDGVTTQGAGPSHCVWNGIKFDKDKAVEVKDPDMIRRARGNKYFKVYDDTPAEKATVNGPNKS